MRSPFGTRASHPTVHQCARRGTAVAIESRGSGADDGRAEPVASIERGARPVGDENVAVWGSGSRREHERLENEKR
jgi:tetraacyldisaccharide-1-P 4'-kinase